MDAVVYLVAGVVVVLSLPALLLSGNIRDRFGKR